MSISAAQAKKAKAEVIREQAETALEQARTQLLNQFGVSQPDEARAMIATLTKQRDDAILAAEEQLKEAQG